MGNCGRISWNSLCRSRYRNSFQICEDEKIGDVTEKIALMQAIETLNDTDKKIITMRYFKGMTQNEVAKVMGMTQVKVSRSEKRIILLLKDGLKCG